MSPTTTQINEIFSSTGVLSQSIAGYSPRKVQLQMALAVAEALEESQVLIAEAGTGTGKTYAYLIPSLLAGKKVIISTGTKNLQDQLFHRDIPLVRRALGTPLKIALLKGRSNYICLHRLNTYSQTDFIADETLAILFKIKRWSEQSQDGEIEHIPGVKPEVQLLPYITSTADNCLGQDCEFFTKCHLLKARKQAQEANILIINHHLFFADTKLKDSGITDLLPDAEAIIFDEAHQLHDVATHFLGSSVSTRQLIFLAKDVQAEQQKDAPDMLTLKLAADKLTFDVKELQKAFGVNSKGAWEHIVHKREIKESIAKVQQALQLLEQQLELAALRGRGLENCWRRSAELRSAFICLTTTFPEDQIHWYDAHETNVTIHHTPLNISSYFQSLIDGGHKSWIFTSATISVRGDFSHFENHLGLVTAIKLHLESPFNYSKQAMLYTPKINVMPNDNNYVIQMLTEIIPVLKLTKGRAFILFTSHKSLKEASHLLSTLLEYPLLVQGSGSKSQLLKQFCELENAILLGTNSFWEGVDVKGDYLSCVVIDKLPFASPDDPILKTRFEHYRKQGKNPFQEYQLPQAVITLRQGAGRLIRDVNDRGVLILCDPRLHAKDYGKIFLQALPPMPVTQRLDEVAHFLQGHNE